MNREQFMKRLRELLGCLPENEREEAVEYYEGYFDDAGVENEADLITSLGSPEKVAKTIIDGYRDEHGEAGEFTENGFSGYGDRPKDEVGQHEEKQGSSGKSKGFGGGGMILLLILAIFALPILGPLIIGIGAAFFGILIAAAALLCTGIITGGALILAGFALIAAAFLTVLVTPAVAAVLIGVGFLLIGIGILIVILGIWVLCKAVPPIIRGIVTCIQNLFRRRER